MPTVLPPTTKETDEMALGSLLQLRVDFEEVGFQKIKVVRMNGKIISSNSLDLNERLKKHFMDGFYDTILDISELEYIDSKGMAMLLTLAKTIKQNGGTFLMTKPSQFVHELLELTNLDTYFDFVENIEAGMQVFQNKS